MINIPYNATTHSYLGADAIAQAGPSGQPNPIKYLVDWLVLSDTEQATRWKNILNAQIVIADGALASLDASRAAQEVQIQEAITIANGLLVDADVAVVNDPVVADPIIP